MRGERQFQAVFERIDVDSEQGVHDVPEDQAIGVVEAVKAAAGPAVEEELSAPGPSNAVNDHLRGCLGQGQPFVDHAVLNRGRSQGGGAYRGEGVGLRAPPCSCLRAV